MTPIRKLALAAALAAVAFVPLEAQGDAADRAVLVLSPRAASDDPALEPDARDLGMAYGNELSIELAGSGFRIVAPPSAAAPGPETTPSDAGPLSVSGIRELSAAAKAAGARFALSAAIQLRNKRATYSVVVVDATYEAVITGDAGTTYAGLTALTVLKDSALAVRERLQRGILEISATSERVPIPYALVFDGVPDGTTFYFGGDERPLAMSENGKLILPYLPLPAGSVLAYTVKREGFYDATGTVKLTHKQNKLRLPSMRPVLDDALFLSWGLGRALGGGVGYRRYLQPDRSFLFVEDDFYFQTDFLPNSTLIPHSDLFFGVGFYPYTDPDSLYRVSLSTGLFLMGTILPQPDMDKHLFLDGGIMPVSIQFETFQFGISWYFEMRLAISLGLPTGVLPVDFLGLTIGDVDHLPPVSLGFRIPL